MADHLPTAHGYAERAIEDVVAVRTIIATVWRGEPLDEDRTEAIRDWLGDAMGSIVAIADELGINL